MVEVSATTPVGFLGPCSVRVASRLLFIYYSVFPCICSQRAVPTEVGIPPCLYPGYLWTCSESSPIITQHISMYLYSLCIHTAYFHVFALKSICVLEQQISIAFVLGLSHHIHTSIFTQCIPPLGVCTERVEERTDGGGHLAPLQHHVLDDASVRVDVDALVLVAQQHLHAVRAGQEHDGVGGHLALDLWRRGRQERERRRRRRRGRRRRTLETRAAIGSLFSWQSRRGGHFHSFANQTRPFRLARRTLCHNPFPGSSGSTLRRYCRYCGK